MRIPLVLWADDEIDLLKPYMIFLEQKGYEVITSNNGRDAVELVIQRNPDIVFLDENMPGLSGLETLQIIKERRPDVPVVMITKSEEEHIMEEAIGSKIADYLIKPVNPNQILLTLKKHVSGKELVSQHSTASYREEFSDFSYVISQAASFDEFCDVYRNLVRWSFELADADPSMRELLATQYSDANKEFARVVRRDYKAWLDSENILMSHRILRTQVLPKLNNEEKVALIVIDNFRYDQWRAVQSIITQKLRITSEKMYCAILPTSTQYARNAIFSGLMPLQIQQRYPQLWVDEGDEDSKNQFEHQLLDAFFERQRRQISTAYYKVNESAFCERITENFRRKPLQANVVAVVINFIDMLSHSRTESQMMRELAKDEPAYLSLTKSWFEHSPTLALFEELRRQGYTLLLTTDHGTKRVQNPVKVIGDRNTNVNIRYKVGKSLDYNAKEVIAFTQPNNIGLPAPNISSHYIFAQDRDFFAYPNNYNYYASFFRDTFQHGGVSLEEMLVPFIELK